MAFDASRGKNLWHFQTGSAIFAAPVTYMLDGKQYLLIPSGTTVFAFALPDSNPQERAPGKFLSLH